MTDKLSRGQIVPIPGYGNESLIDRQELYADKPRCSCCGEPMYRQFPHDKRCGYCRARNKSILRS